QPRRLKAHLPVRSADLRRNNRQRQGCAGSRLRDNLLIDEGWRSAASGPHDFHQLGPMILSAEAPFVASADALCLEAPKWWQRRLRMAAERWKPPSGSQL